MSRLPPLNSLRAFEAAGRHMSFKKAANELNVTPAAVGHQIKNLEQHLGVQLFQRLNRGLRLTDVGQACLPEVTDGFARLQKAVEMLSKRDTRAVLTITVAPSFAAKWLVPRLHQFREDYPDIAVRIDTDLSVIDLPNAGIDLGIRFCSGNLPGHRVDHLMSEELIPVCNPALLKKSRPLRKPLDLMNFTLLHIEGETSDEDWVDWQTWLKLVDHPQVNGAIGPRFTQSMMAVQAAIEGQGVALAPASIVDIDLKNGRLVNPFPDIEGMPTTFAYYVVSPKNVAEEQTVSAFRNWVVQEANESNR